MAPSGSGSKKARASQRNASDRVSQMRKEQQQKDKRRLFAIWGAAAVTIAIVVGAVAFAVINDKAEHAEPGCGQGLHVRRRRPHRDGRHLQGDPARRRRAPPGVAQLRRLRQAGAQRERRALARARRRVDHLPARPARGRRRQAQGRDARHLRAALALRGPARAGRRLGVGPPAPADRRGRPAPRGVHQGVPPGPGHARAGRALHQRHRRLRHAAAGLGRRPAVHRRHRSSTPASRPSAPSPSAS